LEKVPNRALGNLKSEGKGKMHTKGEREEARSWENKPACKERIKEGKSERRGGVEGGQEKGRKVKTLWWEPCQLTVQKGG